MLPLCTDKLESLEKGVIGSHSPHHPNNIKSSCILDMDSPTTPTKPVQVSLIEIRPEQPIRTVKLDPAQVRMSCFFSFYFFSNYGKLSIKFYLEN